MTAHLRLVRPSNKTGQFVRGGGSGRQRTVCKADLTMRCTAFAYRGLIAMLTRLRVPATVALRRPRRRRRHLHGLRGRGRGAVGTFGATVSGAVCAGAA
jgi:hypothetical protein